MAEKGNSTRKIYVEIHTREFLEWEMNVKWKDREQICNKLSRLLQVEIHLFFIFLFSYLFAYMLLLCYQLTKSICAKSIPFSFSRLVCASVFFSNFLIFFFLILKIEPPDFVVVDDTYLMWLLVKNPKFMRNHKRINHSLTPNGYVFLLWMCVCVCVWNLFLA